jgi:hypothetical protein
VRSNQAEFRSNVWHCGTPEPEPEPYRVLRKRLREALMLVIIGLARVDYEQPLHNVSPDNPAFHVLRRCPEFYRWGREEPLLSA